MQSEQIKTDKGNSRNSSETNKQKRQHETAKRNKFCDCQNMTELLLRHQKSKTSELEIRAKIIEHLI